MLSSEAVLLVTPAVTSSGTSSVSRADMFTFFTLLSFLFFFGLSQFESFLFYN